MCRGRVGTACARGAYQAASRGRSTSPLGVANATSGMRTFSKTTPALVASLIGDPFCQAITVDCGVDFEARFSVLSRYFEYSLQEADRTGRCTVHEDPELGAAAWLLPRTPEVEAAEASAKAGYLAGLLGPNGWDNYRRIIEFMSHRSEPLVPEDAWYLTIVGVHPAAQGRGLGAQLVRPTLAEATKAGVHAFLETFTLCAIWTGAAVALAWRGIRLRRAAQPQR
jgi:ribosomal protein S18 acetylase RimI-like enzyme